MSKHLPVVIVALALAALALSLTGLARADFGTLGRASRSTVVQRMESAVACAGDPYCVINQTVPLGAGPRWAGGFGR